MSYSYHELRLKTSYISLHKYTGGHKTEHLYKALHKIQIKNETFSLKIYKVYREVQYSGIAGAHRDYFYPVK